LNARKCESSCCAQNRFCEAVPPIAYAASQTFHHGASRTRKAVAMVTAMTATTWDGDGRWGGGCRKESKVGEVRGREERERERFEGREERKKRGGEWQRALKGVAFFWGRRERERGEIDSSACWLPFSFSCFDTKRTVVAMTRSAKGALRHGNAGGASSGMIFLAVCFSRVASLARPLFPRLSFASHLVFAPRLPSPSSFGPQAKCPYASARPGHRRDSQKKSKKRRSERSSGRTRERKAASLLLDVGARQRCLSPRPINLFRHFLTCTAVHTSYP